MADSKPPTDEPDTPPRRNRGLEFLVGIEAVGLVAAVVVLLIQLLG